MAMTTTQRGRVKIQQGGKRVRTYLRGGLAADTYQPLLVWEVPYYPTYYFPLADVHARDPHTRVDILASSRRVVVRAGQLVIAESTHAHALFETGLPTRWYLPKVDVRMDLLVPSSTLTQCPYKGQASYYSLRAGDVSIDDVAWYYPSPLPESQKIAGMVAFFPDRVTLEVEGE